MVCKDFTGHVCLHGNFCPYSDKAPSAKTDVWGLFTLICYICTMTVLNMCVICYCLFYRGGTEQTIKCKIESSYLSTQERNFPCPCETAVAKAASVCIPGKICKFSHLQWKCIFITRGGALTFWFYSDS